MDQEIYQVCQRCSGSGKYKNGVCPDCKGAGRILFGFLAEKVTEKEYESKTKEA